jgi:hypothetical protein
MMHGKKQAELYNISYCYAWSPTEDHQLVYLYGSVYIGENLWQLYSLDASTGLADRLTAYPEWFIPSWDVTGNACYRPLDIVVGSETPMFLRTPILITLVPSVTPMPSVTPASGYP